MELNNKHNERVESVLIAAGAVAFVNIFLPFADALVALVGNAVSRISHRWQMDMTLDESETQAAVDVVTPQPAPTAAIGFQIPTEEEVYEEDYKERTKKR